MGKKQYLLTVVLAVVAGFAGGVVSSWFLMGSLVFTQKTPEPAKVIQAEKFEVVDKDGKARAELSLSSDGEPSLTLYDKVWTTRAVLGIRDRTPYLELHGKDAKYQATLRPFELRLDNYGYSSIQLRLFGGEPQLSLSGTEGTGVGFGLVGGQPFLDLQGKEGKGGAGLSLSSDGEPSLTLDDKNGKTRATLGSTELKLKRTGSVEQRSAASLVLFGEDGKVVWEAP